MHVMCMYIYRQHIQVYLANEISPPQQFVWKLCKPFPTIFWAKIYDDFLQWTQTNHFQQCLLWMSSFHNNALFSCRCKWHEKEITIWHFKKKKIDDTLEKYNEWSSHGFYNNAQQYTFPHFSVGASAMELLSFFVKYIVISFVLN